MVERSLKTCCAKGLERDLIASLKGERERMMSLHVDKGWLSVDREGRSIFRR